MTIRITRYVDITSGVGGVAAVPRRDFILRQFTQNALVPAGTVVEFSSLADVGRFFGIAADEYKVAEKYFGFVSKTITSPQRMSVARWNSAALPPAVFGSPLTAGLSAFTAITTGALTFSVEGVAVSVTGIDLSTATTMAQVASLLQTEINGNANLQLATATVQYDVNRGALIFTGGVATAGDTITLTAGGLNDISVLVGWATGTQINQDGTAVQSPVQAFQNSQDNDDNFGTFAFTGSVLPTADEYAATSAANHALNNKFIFCVPTTAANAAALSAAMLGYSGTALTLIPGASSPDDHAETIPAEITAALNFNRPGASQNYMFYRLGNRVATVDNDTNADLYDELRVNYMGRTQTAGQKITFYQQGFLTGDTTAALDMAVYVGEMWLKDAITSTVLGGFLALPDMPANENGRITLLSLIQGPIDEALNNGVFSVGKTLDNTQKAYITQITANPDAWRQVESKGYWIDAFIRSEVPVPGVTRYYAEYMLVYAKNDQLRRVVGSDILI